MPDSLDELLRLARPASWDGDQPSAVAIEQTARRRRQRNGLISGSVVLLAVVLAGRALTRPGEVVEKAVPIEQNARWEELLAQINKDLDRCNEERKAIEEAWSSPSWNAAVRLLAQSRSLAASDPKLAESLRATVASVAEDSFRDRLERNEMYLPGETIRKLP